MKKNIKLALAGLAAVSLFSVAVPATTHAATYHWIKTKQYSPTVPYHEKSTASAYVWNAYHTQVKYNLARFPRTTWYKSMAVKMRAGYHSRIYYQVRSGNGRHTGYIWRGYLTPGTNPAATNTKPTPNTPDTPDTPNTPSNGDNSDAAKGILTSTVPYKTVIDNIKVDNPDPATATPSNTLVAINSSTLNQYLQSPSPADLAKIMSFAKTQYPSKDGYRIALERYKTADNMTVKLATVQYLDSDADSESVEDSDATPTYHWTDVGLARNFAEQVNNPQVSSLVKNASDAVFLYGPQYALPDKGAAFKLDYTPKLTADDQKLNEGLIKSGEGQDGAFSFVNLGNGPEYLRTSDILEMPYDQPIQKNGMWIGAKLPLYDANYASTLAAKGITHYRYVSELKFTDMKLQNGKWQQGYIFSWHMDQDPTKADLIIQQGYDKPKITTTVKLSDGISIMDYLTKPDSYFEQLLAKNGNQ